MTSVVDWIIAQEAARFSRTDEGLRQAAEWRRIYEKYDPSFILFSSTNHLVRVIACEAQLAWEAGL